jgi:hypothetical protein
MANEDDDVISLDLEDLEIVVREPPARSASGTKPPPLPAGARRIARGSERAVTAN